MKHNLRTLLGALLLGAGVLAFQIHRGPAMKGHIKDVLLKELPEGGVVAFDKAALPASAAPAEPVPVAEPSPPTQAVPAPVPGASAQTDAGIPPSPVKANDANVSRAVEELNYALQDHRERTGKMPKSLAELVTASKLPVPQLPPGGRLELDQRLKTVKYVGPGGK